MPYYVIHITTLKLKIANKSYDKPKQHIKKQRHYFANKGLYDQSYGFSSNHVWMWELDHKESWAPNKWCFWTVVLEKTLESPLDCKESNQSWRKSTLNIHWKDWCWDEAPIFWPHDARSQLTGKDPDSGKDWRQEEKGTTEDEVVGWHHQLNVQSEQASGDGEGQGSLAHCSPWGLKELDRTEQLTNNNKL